MGEGWEAGDWWGGGGWELGQAVYDFNFNWHPHCLGRP